MGVEIGYALPLAGGGRLEPFGRWTGEGPSGHRLNVGARLSVLGGGEGRARGLTASVAHFGERHAAGPGPARQHFGLRGSIGFR